MYYYGKKGEVPHPTNTRWDALRRIEGTSRSREERKQNKMNRPVVLVGDGMCGKGYVVLVALPHTLFV